MVKKKKESEKISEEAYTYFLEHKLPSHFETANIEHFEKGTKRQAEQLRKYKLAEKIERQKQLLENLKKGKRGLRKVETGKFLTTLQKKVRADIERKRVAQAMQRIKTKYETLQPLQAITPMSLLMQQQQAQIKIPLYQFQQMQQQRAMMIRQIRQRNVVPLTDTQFNSLLSGEDFLGKENLLGSEQLFFDGGVSSEQFYPKGNLTDENFFPENPNDTINLIKGEFI